MKALPLMPPAAFTIVMGTGALALASQEISSLIPWAIWFAHFLNYLNFAIFCILAIWGGLTWPESVAIMRGDFEHPDKCALYSALGIALLVLGAQALRFRLGDAFACIIWGTGAIVTFIFNYGILLRFFLHPGVEIEHVTPVLFVPVASMVVVPVGGAPISAMFNQPLKDIILLFSALALGGGLALYAGLFSMMLQRHFLLKPLPDILTPTLWIHIAPIGWSGVALIAISENILPQEYRAPAQLLALLLFGAAMWWLIMASLICIRALARRTLCFSLTWWSFIFPIGSVTILSRRLDFTPAQHLAPALWLLLLSLWACCALKTLLHLRR